jgi:hypothetical protein
MDTVSINKYKIFIETKKPEGGDKKGARIGELLVITHISIITTFFPKAQYRVI